MEVRRSFQIRLVAFRFALAAAAVVFHPPPAGGQTSKRVVDVRGADGTVLKATYFSPGKRGPAVMLFHMCDGGRRQAWDGVGEMLAARGVHAIAFDYRGFGDSGGERENALSRAERRRVSLEVWPGDIDTVFQFLASQTGVDSSGVGAAGGSCGGWNAVQFARRHRNVRTLVLLAGGGEPAREFVAQTPGMPVLAAAAHDDLYDAVAVMRKVIDASRNPHSRMMEYATGGHGTDMCRTHKDLEPAIADWFVRHLIATRTGPSSR